MTDQTMTHEQALEWSKTLLDGERVTYKQAEKAVAELGDGWRLPTRQELESLLDLSRHDPAIDVEKYPDTQSSYQGSYYWTSTPCAWNPDAARWVVDFYGGYVDGLCRGYGACVRAVRAGQLTDMTHTLDALIALASGDDGLPDDLRAGVERLRARLFRSAVPEGYKLVPETMPDWGAAPPGATHYQPHQDAYYKRVSASEWYVWSRMNDREPMRWHPSLGTGDNAEWVVRPAEAQPGWYCAHCQRGVDAREVTYSEQHEVCGRYIANDDPPPPSAPVGVPSAKTLASVVWSDWMTNEQADRLGDALHRWLTAYFAQQPAAAGEEIMVNTPYDVFTLPLQPSGLDGNGPRFVVHVPAPQRESVTVRYDLSPAQTESAISDALIRMGWTPPEDESAATVKAERDALRERVKELEADAARYRWLREECKNPTGGLTIASVTEWGLEGWSGDDPDNRIDAAMQEGEA